MNSDNRQIVDLKNKHECFFALNQQPFTELLTFIDFADNKLNIGLVEINFAQDRDILIQALVNHPNCQDIQFEIVNCSDPNLRFLRDDLVTALKQIEIATDKKLILLITGLEKSIKVLGEYPDVLVNLNFVRDDLRVSVPHPLLLFLPNYALTRLAKYAPDFWAWNRKVFDFKTVRSTLDTTTNNTIFSDRSINSLELPEKQERIKLLKCLLREHSSSDQQKNKHNQATIVNIYNQLGIAYCTLGKYQKSIGYLQKSLEIARQISDRNGEGNSLMGLGIAYNSLGEYQRAIDFYQKSLEIKQQIGDRNGEGASLNNLGLAYNSLGEYQRAIDFYQQSLEIAQQIGDRHGSGNSLMGLGNAYRSLGEYQRAIDFYQQSLEIAQQIGDRNGEGNSLNNLGNVYNSLGEYQRAIDFYQQSLEIAQQIGDKRGEANSWFNLGITYKNLQQDPEAIAAYENARKLYQTMELDKYVEECDQAIQDVNSDLG